MGLLRPMTAVSPPQHPPAHWVSSMDVETLTGVAVLWRASPGAPGGRDTRGTKFPGRPSPARGSSFHRVNNMVTRNNVRTIWPKFSNEL